MGKHKVTMAWTSKEKYFSWSMVSSIKTKGRQANLPTIFWISADCSCWFFPDVSTWKLLTPSLLYWITNNKRKKNNFFVIGFDIWKKGKEWPLSRLLFIKWNTFVCGKSPWNDLKNKVAHKQMPECVLTSESCFSEPEFLDSVHK